MNWDWLDRPNAPRHLDFENKWWEGFGMRTEDKGFYYELELVRSSKC